MPREIIQQGCQNIPHLGDPDSDLAGGYAERGLNFFNPFNYTL